jgi:hypothetical protein
MSHIIFGNRGKVWGNEVNKVGESDN